MLSAFLRLTEMNIAHCDIKPENILIMDCQNLTMKLCDVGSCKVVSKENAEEATILGTVPFLAPELFNLHAKSSNKIVSTNPFKSDVFSFGLVVLYMITFKKFTSIERV
jgi:serine/threonine protein kinase